ncbi:uncharacterized protein LOC130825611 isoform X2 [Amaranthus tricolor]|uniref:uncharacterized protein LOC130825611 isoform X2 n=1 Tax=Amaranthus tricolor TaxID=29722 RepID=UPI0025890E91|nr:uncharacterized protein LOC130825611 isoform X2 [Amaranthus tricolor]
MDSPSNAQEMDCSSTEGTLLALLDFLVEPLLPSRPLSRESISALQHESVSKQVHAVVLLYNYYHRKQHPELAFLDFQSFCKLSMGLKPNLQLYFRRMQMTDNAELDETDEDLSLTEKAIMNACDTSISLDASIDNPVIVGWPVTRVAVFLVDSRKENCYLCHSAMTQGVLSLIEKEVDDLGPANKKIRVIKKSLNENQSADGSCIQQFAYEAVKETCGIDQGALKILEKHLVYSTSKAKTAVCLYIIQCRKANLAAQFVPINDVMDSLQGPVVKMESHTPVVEYFHLLPFADKLSGWLMREMSKSSFDCPDAPLEEEPLSMSEQKFTIDHATEHPFVNIIEPCEATDTTNGNNGRFEKESILDASKNSEDINIRNGDLLASETTEKLRNSNRSSLKKDSLYASRPSEAPADKNVVRFHLDEQPCPYTSDHPEAKKVEINSSYRRREDPVVQAVYKKRYKSPNSCGKCPGNRASNGRTDHPRQENDEAASTGGAVAVVKSKVDFPRRSSNECDVEKAFSDPKLAIASKENLISETALKALFKRREQLTKQYRNIADQIALCDRNIQTILSGGENDLAVKIDTIVEACNEMFLRNAAAAVDNAAPPSNDEEILPIVKRKRLSEASLCMQNPCQELDGICTKNLWILPTYNVSVYKGSFQASVMVKGVDFESSSKGNICETPHEARNSAASNMLVKLRSLVATS